MRDNDERKTEGAGDSDIPNWVDRDAIPQKQTLFISAMNGMAAKPKKTNKVIFSFCANSTFEWKCIGKGHRENIAHIFNDKGAINLIGVTGKDKVMVKINTPIEANRIAKGFLRCGLVTKPILVLLLLMKLTNSHRL